MINYQEYFNCGDTVVHERLDKYISYSLEEDLRVINELICKVEGGQEEIKNGHVKLRQTVNGIECVVHDIDNITGNRIMKEFVRYFLFTGRGNVTLRNFEGRGYYCCFEEDF